MGSRLGAFCRADNHKLPSGGGGSIVGAGGHGHAITAQPPDGMIGGASGAEIRCDAPQFPAPSCPDSICQSASARPRFFLGVMGAL
jgi:hypothetical protein